MPKNVGRRMRARMAGIRQARAEEEKGLSAAQRTEASNPFAQHRNARGKHNVLGRHVKGAERNVALARSKADARRAGTLLKEYKAMGKANSFQDRRFGERDEDMTREDKMLARLVKARTKQAKKKSVFNLGDEGGTSISLTHFGKALGSEPAGYSNMGDRDFDADLDSEITDKLHFGGGDDDDGAMPDWRGKTQLPAWMNKGKAPNEPKTRKEVLMEVIAKAKHYKAERAKDKAAQEDMLVNLDGQLGDIKALLRAEGGKDITNKASRDEPADDYDMMVRDIAQQPRKAKPSDRLKTDEEVAKAEFERLRKLEKARKQRMSMTYTADTKRGPTDDDLVDDFQIDASLVDVGSDADVSDDDEEEEDSDEVDDSGDDESSDEEEGAGKKKSAKQQQEEEVAISAVPGLPFLLECPTDMESWASMVQQYGCDAVTIKEMITRLRARFSAHLAPENKSKLATLHTILPSFLATLHPTDKLSTEDIVAIGEVMLGPLHELAQYSAAVATTAWTTAVAHMHERIEAALSSRGATSAWPTVGEIVAMKIASHLFPVTDYRHVVLTPLMILLGQCLSQCVTRTQADVASGLAVCALLIDLTTEAGRAVPEVLTFLHGILCCLAGAEHVEDATQAVALPSLLGSKGLEPLSWLRQGVASWMTAAFEVARQRSDELPRMQLSAMAATDEPTSSECMGLAVSCIHLLQRAAEAVSGNDACPEMLHPLWLATTWHSAFVDSLVPSGKPQKQKKRQRKSKSQSKEAKQHQKQLMSAAMPYMELAHDTAAGLNTLMQQADNSRGALQLQDKAQRAKAIQTLDPLFDDDYIMAANSASDPKAQIRKLKREVRREQKGVARELRKDAQYVAKARYAELDARDEERAAKAREILTFLEQQQATFNQMVKTGDVKGGGSRQPITKSDRRKRKRGM